METKKRKTYRNFTRSEKAIIRSYVELLRQKDNKRITVTDIVTTADLNRSTFYAHFKSAEDVREKIHADIIKEITGDMSRRDYRNSLSDPRSAMLHVLNFIRNDEEMYKILLNTDGAATFLKRLEDTVIEQYLTDSVILPYIKNRDEFELNLRLFIGGFISVLQDWASGIISVPLERAIDIMSESIKNCAKYYLKK